MAVSTLEDEVKLMRTPMGGAGRMNYVLQGERVHQTREGYVMTQGIFQIQFLLAFLRPPTHHLSFLLSSAQDKIIISS